MKCITKPTNDEIDQALAGDIKELWSLISTLEGDEEFEEEKDNIQWGIKIVFNIEFVCKGHIIEYPHTKTAHILGHKKIDINHYWNELRLREQKCKDMLRAIYDYGNQGEEYIKGHEDE